MSLSGPFVEDGWHKCDNCGEIWHGESLRPIEDMEQRVEAGSTLPSGECPDPHCGALCYPAKPLEGKDAQRHGMGVGYCQLHGSYKMDSEETPCPLCDDVEL